MLASGRGRHASAGDSRVPLPASCPRLLHRAPLGSCSLPPSPLLLFFPLWLRNSFKEENGSHPRGMWSSSERLAGEPPGLGRKRSSEHSLSHRPDASPSVRIQQPREASPQPREVTTIIPVAQIRRLRPSVAGRSSPAPVGTRTAGCSSSTPHFCVPCCTQGWACPHGHLPLLMLLIPHNKKNALQASRRVLVVSREREKCS